MNAHVKDVVREMSEASDEERITFPEVVKALAQVGIERYHADLVAGRKTYYMPDGDFRGGGGPQGQQRRGDEILGRRRGERRFAPSSDLGDRLWQILPPDRGRGLRPAISLVSPGAGGLLWAHGGRACRMVSRREVVTA